ncbi:MAG: exonuclease SbcCD subunit D [Gemmatimonadales bacterium]
MRLVHLSDLHLGFRQFQRTTPTGINQREWDVAQSFTRAVDRVIELRPDIVLIAGDVFHTVRPTNPAILHAFAQFSRLMRELPDAIVVIVAGNHDMPRSSETLCILRLFAPLGIHVVDTDPRRLPFPDRGLSILAVPAINADKIAVEPDLAADLNILVAHGVVEGDEASFSERVDPASLVLRREDLANPAWDYVALGHIHVYEKVAPKGFYSGSLDYTSSNIWGEVQQRAMQKLPGGGMLEFDLETQKAPKFHAIQSPREFVDLPPIAGKGLSAADLDARIAAAVDRAGSIDGKVVRLVARDVPRNVARELDQAALRDYRRRALHFNLDMRRPELTLPSSASGAPGHRPSLAEMLRDSLRNRMLTSDIDRDRLVELGAHYLREAELAGTPRGLSAPGEET